MLLTTNKRCPLKLRTVATLRTCSNNRAGGVIKPCPVFLPLHPQRTLGVVYSSVLYLCPVIVLALLECVIVYVFRGRRAWVVCLWCFSSRHFHASRSLASFINPPRRNHELLKECLSFQPFSPESNLRAAITRFGREFYARFMRFMRSGTRVSTLFFRPCAYVA